MIIISSSSIIIIVIMNIYIYIYIHIHIHTYIKLIAGRAADFPPGGSGGRGREGGQAGT